MATFSRGFTGRPREAQPDLPPGQFLTEDFPVLSAGPTPTIAEADWSFTIKTELGATHSWSWDELQALPFEDARFDVVLSTFGVMFAPDQQRSASEMARVCRPGGRIGMANWTPEGFIGQLFKTLGRHLPPPVGVKPPSLWGVRTHLETLFGDQVSAIATTPKVFNFRYRSAEHFVEIFRTWYGPVHKAFAALTPEIAALLERDLIDLLNRLNQGGEHSLVVPSEYLEVVITRR